MKPKHDQVAVLWKQYQKTKSHDARNRLVEHYLPLVHKLAEILARRLWPRVSADELASAAQATTAPASPVLRLIIVLLRKGGTPCFPPYNYRRLAPAP